jgi:hypothetical protein
MSVWKEVPAMFRRQIVVWSLFIHQVSTSSLLDNLGSWFVSMGMVYCVMEAFVTVVRACSRLIESCVGLPTSLYTGTLRLLQPLIQRCRTHSSNLSLFFQRHLTKKKNVPKKVPLKIILRSSESHQIKMLEHHNFGIPLVVPDTVVFHHTDTHI